MDGIHRFIAVKRNWINHTEICISAFYLSKIDQKHRKIDSALANNNNENNGCHNLQAHWFSAASRPISIGLSRGASGLRNWSVASSSIAEMPASTIFPYLVQILGLNTALRPVFSLWLFNFEQVGLDHLTMYYFYPFIPTANWRLRHTRRKNRRAYVNV